MGLKIRFHRIESKEKKNPEALTDLKKNLKSLLGLYRAKPVVMKLCLQFKRKKLVSMRFMTIRRANKPSGCIQSSLSLVSVKRRPFFTTYFEN